MNLRTVTVKDDNAWAHMFADDLSTILHELRPGEVGFVLPGIRNSPWHSYQMVITGDKWGWVAADCLEDAPQV